MSTIWLAHRCGCVYSREHDQSWYEIVRKTLRKRKIGNVQLKLRAESVYTDLSEYPDRFFDLAIIDGLWREASMSSAISKVKGGGWIYLDNTDLGLTAVPDTDCQRAERVLLRAVSERNGSARYFVDFAPTSFVVSQGMLARI